MSKARDQTEHSTEQTSLLASTGGEDDSYGTVIAKLPAVPDDGGQALQPAVQRIESTTVNESTEEAIRPTKTTDSTITINPYMGGVSKTRFWLIFTCTLLQYFVATFDSTLMASSHPLITSYFNASNSASWLSTAFLITSTSFQPLFGRVSDTTGRRPPYILAFLILGAGTLWCALAQSIGSFIAARAVCGLGASGVLAMGSILTNDLVPIEIRGTYQSYINIFYGAGSACGAAFGGALCESIGWRWAFGIQVPFVFLIFVMAVITTPTTLGPRLAETSGQSVMESLKAFDNAGSLFLVIAVSTLVLGMNLGGNVLPWSSPIVIASLAIAGVSALLLIYIERKAARPVMPLVLLSTRPRGNLIYSNFFANVGYNTLLFNIPLYFQAVKLESASASGFRIGPAFVFSTGIAVATGFIINATGQMKALLTVGGLLSLVGSVLLSLVRPEFNAWIATLFLVPVSSGQGFNFPATSVAILSVSTQEEQAVTTSSLSLFRSLGQVMGVAVSSLVLQNTLSAYLWDAVSGDDGEKSRIILRVRKSVHAISELGPKHQGEVISAYAKALQMTFVLSIVSYAAVNLLLLPVKIPKLAVKKRRRRSSVIADG
jgi:MFS family permease